MGTCRDGTGVKAFGRINHTTWVGMSIISPVSPIALGGSVHCILTDYQHLFLVIFFKH